MRCWMLDDCCCGSSVHYNHENIRKNPIIRFELTMWANNLNASIMKSSPFRFERQKSCLLCFPYQQPMREARDWFLCSTKGFVISSDKPPFGVQTKLPRKKPIEFDCVSDKQKRESMDSVDRYLCKWRWRRGKEFFWRGRMASREIIEDIHHQKNISKRFADISVAPENYGLLLFIISLWAIFDQRS